MLYEVSVKQGWAGIDIFVVTPLDGLNVLSPSSQVTVILNCQSNMHTLGLGSFDRTLCSASV